MAAPALAVSKGQVPIIPVCRWQYLSCKGLEDKASLAPGQKATPTSAVSKGQVPSILIHMQKAAPVIAEKSNAYHISV